jgi:hypothetical protein
MRRSRVRSLDKIDERERAALEREVAGEQRVRARGGDIAMPSSAPQSLAPGKADEQARATLPDNRKTGKRGSAASVDLTGPWPWGDHSHEEAIVVCLVQDVRRLFDDLGEYLRIDQRDGKGLVERVVVPIDFR